MTQTTKKIVAFRVSWTADHEQYYQGHGISGTDYTHSGNGCGETLREAFEDALNDLAQQADWLPELWEASCDDESVSEATILAELTDQVKELGMLDWDIVQAECQCINCPACTGAVETGSDEDPDEHKCAVCAGEWHFYVNVDVQVSDAPTYQVVVGNIGAVYSGTSLDDATKAYAEYVGQSRLGYGAG